MWVSLLQPPVTHVAERHRRGEGLGWRLVRYRTLRQRRAWIACLCDLSPLLLETHLIGQILSKTAQAGNRNLHYKLLIGACDQPHKAQAKRDLALPELYDWRLRC
jgi:hypothetical protein